jgi:hypothetical protein
LHAGLVALKVTPKSPVCPRAGGSDDGVCRSLQGNEAQGEIALKERKNLNAAREQKDASDQW